MKLRRILIFVLSSGLFINTLSCGTVFYPERKGQIDGKIDPKVAVGNALALLFFIIPGVIAFAVDFSNGTIYLPGTQSDMKKIQNDDIKDARTKDGINNELLEKVIKEELGIDVDLDRDEVVVREFRSGEKLEKNVAMLGDFN